MDPEPRLTSGRIAELVGGELVGPPDTVIRGFASLDRAGPSDVAFLASARYLPYFQRTNAGAVLLPSRFREVTAGPACRIVVGNPFEAFAEVAATLHVRTQPRWGLHPSASIGRGTRWEGRLALGAHARLGHDVQLGRECVIDVFAFVEDGAIIGDRCHIGPHAVVHAGTVLGNRVTLEAGARVGTSGFRYAASESGHRRLPHLGSCTLADDVDIGANTTVDRGSLGETLVGKGTKIDNLVQVGHNVRIGERCLIMAQVGIAGSTVVEDRVMLAGQVGLAGHLTVGAEARVAAQAGVIGDVPAGATVSGYPARRHRDVLRQTAALGRLTPFTKSLERLAKSDDAR